METPEQCLKSLSKVNNKDVFVAPFQQTLHVVLLFALLSLNKQIFSAKKKHGQCVKRDLQAAVK